MRWRRSSGNGPLSERIQTLEEEIRLVRREAAELRAAHDDAIELALISAVRNGLYRLIVEVRASGWTVTYRRPPQSEGYGTIVFEHPQDAVHNRSIELPLPEDEAHQRRIETDIRMRVGLLRAA